MDDYIQKLCTAFVESLSPIQSVRQAASQFLVQAQSTPGFASACFQILRRNDLPLNVRHSAAISFKNIAIARWAPYDPNIQPLNEDEKNFIKAHFVETITFAPIEIRLALETALKDPILFHDFPDKWPEFGGQVMSMLQSNDPTKIMGALICIRHVCKAFEFIRTADPKRQVLYTVVEQVFPVLYELFRYLLTVDQPESWEMQLVLLKTFYAGTQFVVPPYFVNDTSRFQAWMELMYMVFLKPEPSGVDTSDPFKRGKHVSWRCKKWIAHCWIRFLQRYGKPHKDLPQNQAFSKHFMPTYSAKLIETVLSVLMWKAQGAFIPDQLTVLLIGFLNSAIMYGSTYPLVQPHIEGVFHQILFPSLYLQERDWHLFLNDPEEFIRLVYDPKEEIHDVTVATVSFIDDIINYRASNFLNYLLSYVQERVTRYSNTPPEQRDYREKYACMTLFGALSKRIEKNNELSRHVSSFLEAHIIPELKNPLPFVQYKAAWCIGQFYNAKYEKAQVLFDAVEGLLHLLLNSEHFVVRFEAALSLSHFAHQQVTQQLLQPIIMRVVQIYFDLVDAIDNEDLIAALQVIIANFPDEIAPIASQIVTRFVEHFTRIMNTSDKEDDAALLTAIQITKGITTVLKSCSKVPAVYLQLEPVLLPFLAMIFQMEGSDFLEDAIDAVTCLTYFGEITENTWQMYNYLLQALMTYAPDYASEILAPLDNFISLSTEKFLTGDRLQNLCAVLERFIGNPKMSEYDSSAMCKLAEVLLIYCQGRIDHVVPTLMQITLSRLAHCKQSQFKAQLLSLICCFMYYNPATALAVLQQTNQTHNILKQIFDELTKKKKKKIIFTSLHTKRVVALGLTNLLQLPLAQLPFQHLMRDFLMALINFINMWEEQRQDEIGDTDDEDSTQQVQDDEDVDEDDEEDDEDEDEDDAAAPGKTNDGTYVATADVDDGEADMEEKLLQWAEAEEAREWDDEEDEDWSSKIDEIDPIVFFYDVFMAFTQREGQVAQQLLQSLPPEIHELLKQFTEISQRRKAKALLKAQKKQQQTQ